MTLRVAHVLNAPGRGGVPRVAAALVRHGDRSCVAPHVYYLKNGDGPDLFKDLDIPIGCASGEGGKGGAMTELVGWLDAQRIEALHTHSFRPNLYARVAGAVLKPRGLRIIAHYHNDYSEKWQAPEILTLERRLADVTDAAIAVSDAVADHVGTMIPARRPIEVVENGLDRARLAGDRATGRQALGLMPEDIAVDLIGRVCRQKGVDTFVDAAILLARDHPNARFLIIGDLENPDLHASLASQIDAAGLKKTIRFTGHRDDMGDVLAALDLLAAPSRWEGFGLALAEAMWAGVPIVAAPVGGIPSVTGNAARLVAPCDAGALAAELAGLITDPQARDALSVAGRAAEVRFDWATAARKVEQVYSRVCGAS